MAWYWGLILVWILVSLLVEIRARREYRLVEDAKRMLDPAGHLAEQLLRVSSALRPGRRFRPAHFAH